MCSKFMPYMLAMNVGTVMIAAQPEIFLTTSFCCTEITARLACSTLVSSSRWVLMASSMRRTWSVTSRMCSPSSDEASAILAETIWSSGCSSGCTAR